MRRHRRCLETAGALPIPNSCSYCAYLVRNTPGRDQTSPAANPPGPHPMACSLPPACSSSVPRKPPVVRSRRSLEPIDSRSGWPGLPQTCPTESILRHAPHLQGGRQVCPACGLQDGPLSPTSGDPRATAARSRSSGDYTRREPLRQELSCVRCARDSSRFAGVLSVRIIRHPGRGLCVVGVSLRSECIARDTLRPGLVLDVGDKSPAHRSTMPCPTPTSGTRSRRRAGRWRERT